MLLVWYSRVCYSICCSTRRSELDYCPYSWIQRLFSGPRLLIERKLGVGYTYKLCTKLRQTLYQVTSLQVRVPTTTGVKVRTTTKVRNLGAWGVVQCRVCDCRSTGEGTYVLVARYVCTLTIYQNRARTNKTAQGIYTCVRALWSRGAPVMLRCIRGSQSLSTHLYCSFIMLINRINQGEYLVFGGLTTTSTV